ncbi:hypothetical protein D3C87_860110 [compost metagenome]
MPMQPQLKELMWDAHRAEGEAAHEATALHGAFYDIRGEQTIPVTPEGIFIYNLGVAAGVKALLNQLSDAGYTVADKEGVIIESHDADGHGVFLGDRFDQWLVGGPDNE